MVRFYLVLRRFSLASLLMIVPAAAGAQSAAAPLRERPALGSTITVSALGTLPASENPLSLVDAAQADLVSERIDTGGLSPAEPARMGAHGSTWTQTRFHVGSADITDPEGRGSPLLMPPVVFWERVDLATGLMPLELNAPGLALVFEPRQPGNTWSGTLGGSFSGSSLISGPPADAPPPIARLDGWSHGDLFAGGPIQSGVALAVAADVTHASRFERDRPTLLRSTIGSLFAHLDLTPSPDNDVRTIVWLQRAQSPLALGWALGQPDAASQASAVHAQASWDRHAGADFTSTIFASVTARHQEPDTTSAPAAVAVERLDAGPVPEIVGSGTRTDIVWSAGARAVLPAVTLWNGAHRAHVGVEVSGGRAQVGPAFTGMVGELINGLPARVWRYTDPAPDSIWNKTTLAVYGSDRFQIHPRVLLEGGLRFESTGGSADGSADSIRWNNWLPRGSFRWEIVNRMGLAAFVGYGRYGYELPLGYLAYGDPNAPTASVFRWTAASGNHSPQPTEIGPLIARVGPGTGGSASFSAIDPNLQRPHMDELALGFESRPAPSTVVRLAAIARRDRDIAGLLNLGVPISSYSIVRIPDPGLDLAGAHDDQVIPVYNRSPATFGADRYFLTNPSDDQATYVGVDATAQTTIRRFTMLFGATAGRSDALSAYRGFQAIENDHGVIGELFTNPNAALFTPHGRIFTERGYTMKIAGIYDFPWDLRLGFIARYQDGQHFARLVIVPNLNQGPEAVRAFANGLTRFSFSATLDTRLEKRFVFGSRRVDLMIDAYNLLNSDFEVEEFPVTGPTSRLTSAVQPPRAVHLGVRVAF